MKNIELKNGIWRGCIELEIWNNFFDDVKGIELNIGGDVIVKKINEMHENAYKYLVDNQEMILNMILENLLAQYSNLQAEYGYEDDELEEYMPNIQKIEELKHIIKPKRIHIMDVSNENMAYVGFYFLCSWDEEHGFGVMTHKNRIIKSGDGDISFLSWVAEEDKNSKNE